MANNIIELPLAVIFRNQAIKLQTKIEDCNDPEIKKECIDILKKTKFRMELLLLCIQKGFDPHEFLVIPKSEE
jgi:hypothetical protein